MFNYKWNLKDGFPAKGIAKHKLKVYSTFACGGGSSMGYKLAGYDVIGANDIDPQMAKVYKANFNPKYYDLCPISNLLTKELPKGYYNLDVLDGSPPCSTFSMAGSREKKWKKNTKFREGQSKQVLSDLFYDWIKLVDRLRPKVAIAENVKGMLIGNAKAYTKSILEEIDKIGYQVQLFLLDSSKMGVPQKRQRVFFICSRKDLKLPKIEMNFGEESIPFRNIEDKEDRKENLTKEQEKYWNLCKPGESHSKYHPTGQRFNYFKVSPNKPVPTLTTSADRLEHYNQKRILNDIEWSLASTFPLDYNNLDIKLKYLIGMSVPPVMMAQVSYQIYKQLFNGE